MPNPIKLARKLSDDLKDIRFSEPVVVVYNPLKHAWKNHREYLQKYASGRREIVFLGMNPGPWGMAQTGVPFGDPQAVRDVLGINGQVKKPDIEHPKRPILGCDSPRREVSGSRVWSWVHENWGGLAAFSERCVIMNYCPLAFLEASGRNRTPDKLPKAERDQLFEACDTALRGRIAYHRPRIVIGFGTFAEKRAKGALGDMNVDIGRVLHPSPASPRANRGWPTEVALDLKALGIDWP